MRSIFRWWDWVTGRKREIDSDDVKDLAESVFKKILRWLQGWRASKASSRQGVVAGVVAPSPIRARRASSPSPGMESSGAAAMRDLLQALKHRDGDKRHAAALALGRLGEAARDAVPALAPLLADVMPRVREAARDSLHRIEKDWVRHPEIEEAVPPLVDALCSRTSEVAQAAMRVILEIGPATIPALLTVLDDDARDLRQVFAAQAIGCIGIGEKRVVEALGRLLKSDKTHVKRAAAEALAQLGSASDSTVPLLAPLLADWNVSVRLAAAQCLGQVGVSAAPAVPLLCRLLADEDAGVRDATVKSLAQIGLIALSLLIELLERRDLNDIEQWMRWQAETGDWLTHLNPEAVSWDPTRAIRNLSWQFQQSLFELEQRTRRLHQNVTLTLGRMGPGAAPAVSALVRALDDQDAGLRLAAIKALGEIGPASLPAVASLVGQLSDSRETHRKAAVEALQKIKAAWASTSEARRAMTGLVESLRSRGSPTGAAAFDALVLMGAAAVPVLSQALTNSDRVIREAAAEALGKIGPAARDALPALRKATQDEHGWVREAAERALKQIEAPDGQ